MPLETATYINDLVTSNPAGADSMNAGDDHIRLIKSAVKNTFPSLTGALTRTVTGGAGVQVADGDASGPSLTFASSPILGFYHNPATSSDDISFNGTLRGVGAVPSGAIMDFGQTSAPSGWLACDGQAVSRTTFANLFAAIGTTWGAGDGSTTFNVPSLLSRFRRHRQVGGLAGAVGTLQSPVNLTHTHGVTGTTDVTNTDHTHGFSGNTGAMSANASHTHTSTNNTVSVSGINNNSGGGGGAFSAMSSATATITINATNTDHTHAFSGTTGGSSVPTHSHTFTTTSAASGDASEARPYTAVVLACIKT